MKRIPPWLLTLALFLYACSSLKPLAGPPETTIIFVPGYEGSRLVDRDGGGTVWVSVGEALFRSRSLRLPLAELGLPAQVEVTPSTVVDHVSIIPGIYSVDIYGSLLDSLRETAGPRGEVIGLAYDWRLDPMLAVHELSLLIDKTRARGARKVFVVAHSMGGLITSYYLRYGDQAPQTASPSWAGAAKIDRVVLVGTPFRGAMTTFRNMLYGDRSGGLRSLLEPFAVSSFPACYYLLPAPALDTLLSPRGEKVHDAIRQPVQWRNHHWGLMKNAQSISATQAEGRAKYISTWLQKSTVFSARLLDRSGPVPPTRPRALALYGKAHPTLARGLQWEGKDGLENDVLFDSDQLRASAPNFPVRLTKDDGDGTVTLESARSPAALREALSLSEKELSSDHLELVTERENQRIINDFLNEP